MRNRTLSSDQRSLSLVTKMMKRMNIDQDADMTLEGEIGGEVYTVSNLQHQNSMEDSANNLSMNKKLDLNASTKQDGALEPVQLDQSNDYQRVAEPFLESQKAGIFKRNYMTMATDPQNRDQQLRISGNPSRRPNKQMMITNMTTVDGKSRNTEDQN